MNSAGFIKALPPTWKPAEPKASAKLSVQVNGPGSGFTPGQTITGFVHRQAKTVSPQAWISIALIGRSIAKLKIEDGTGDKKTHYHYNSDFYLLNGQRHVLFEGPLHIPENSPDGQAWPFAIPIPTHASPSIPAKQDPSYCFVPWDPAGSQPPQPLPFTFHASEGVPSSSMEAWVEYFLFAELAEEHGGRTKSTATSVLPVTLLPPRSIPAMPPSYGHAHLTLPLRRACTVVSQRLLPGMDNARLTLSQRAKKLFKTSSVPQYAFHVCAQLPGQIVLDNGGAAQDQHPRATAAVPLWIKIVPDREGSDALLEKTEQVVRLTRVEVRVWAGTGVTMEGWRIGQSDGYKASEVARVVVDGAGQAGGRPGGAVLPVEVPCDGHVPEKKEKEEEEEEKAAGTVAPLDVGSLLGLRFGTDTVEVLGERKEMVAGRWGVKKGLCPDFVTYNIRREHQLEVRMELELAREKVKVEFKQGIAVVAG